MIISLGRDEIAFNLILILDNDVIRGSCLANGYCTIIFDY